MLRHERAPEAIRIRRSRRGLAGIMAATVLIVPLAVPALAQTAIPPTPGSAAGVPAAGDMPAPAMVQAPAAPVPPRSPTAPVVPVPAATPPASSTGPTPDTSPAAFQATVGRDKAQKIESHIARLHAALKITPGEEGLWQAFATVMRQNVIQMDAIYAKREASYGTMNAVQDLESYGEVQEANAHNVQMLLPPFQALYDALTPDQKKAADVTFLRNTDKALKKSH